MKTKKQCPHKKQMVIYSQGEVGTGSITLTLCKTCGELIRAFRIKK